MREFVAGAVTVALSFITASIVFQVVRNPTVPVAALGTVNALGADLFQRA